MMIELQLHLPSFVIKPSMNVAPAQMQISHLVHEPTAALDTYVSYLFAGAYRGATHRLLDGLPWDAILPCHGEYIPKGGKQTLTKHLGLKR